ncbi:AMP-binding protein [Nocardioides sp. LS1]|uniref:AMP-binding protein n=1 Tax=Nocardioides sp. LS1 TaxID=1027620 RepID=UPI000FFABA64|nr:AMP-binding protein [Nocardioides sp. LS1]GCD88134.1 ATP-dependent acyl-CoA ligase [Nocardioides sp. LS1]
MSIPSSLVGALRTAASDVPDHEFLRIAGESFTYRQALGEVEAAARGLRALGVGPGERVGLMCDNRAEVVWAWLGVNAARAIDVPFNAEARGRLLAYFVDDARPKVLIGTEDYLQILADAITHDPEFVVCIGEHTTTPFGERARQLSFEELSALGRSTGGELEEARPGETATIMYTSGTTGPSKGVMLPQRYYPSQAAHITESYPLSADEVIYCVQPLFHIDARGFLSTVVGLRATAILGQRFSASRFWDELREHGATSFGTIGTMLWLLYKQPPRDDDRDVPARLAMCSSTPADIWRGFEERFDVTIVEGYGMTECLLLTCSTADGGQTPPGRIGRPAPGIEIRLVDDDDAPVPQGEVGELIYRTRDEFAMMQGYWNKPEATAEAWRNLWFHTGDLVRRYDDGSLEYIGRKKDSIRRRGENVSAWEVETAVLAHPHVLEAAAIGVPSEVGEEDVAVLVVSVPGQTVDPAQLVEFVSTDLPRFAVPRYVEVVDSLPKTPSERIEKGKVRERGLTAAAWDANVVLGRR